MTTTPPGPGGLRWRELQGASSAGPIACARAGRFNTTVCAGSHSGAVLALSAQSGQLLALWRSHSASVADVDVHESDAAAWSLHMHPHAQNQSQVQPGRIGAASLVSAGTDGVCVLHLLGSKLRLRGASVGRPLKAVTLNPYRASLEAATGGRDCCVRVLRWSRVTGTPLLVAYKHLPSEIHSMLWNPSHQHTGNAGGSILAVASDDALLLLGQRPSSEHRNQNANMHSSERVVAIKRNGERSLSTEKQISLGNATAPNGAEVLDNTSHRSSSTSSAPAANSSADGMYSLATAAAAEIGTFSSACELAVLSELPRPEGSNASALRPPTLGHAPVHCGIAISWGDCAQVVAGVWEGKPTLLATVRPGSPVSGAECVGRSAIALLCNPSSECATLRVYAIPSGELAEESAVGVANSARPGAMRLTSAQDCLYASTPVGLLVGKQAPPGDRARWLASCGRHIEAADEAVAAESDEPGVTNEIAERSLVELLQGQKCCDAAAVCHKLFHKCLDAGVWERWAFRFASFRCLHELAPLLPTASPQLRKEVYELALGNMVAHTSKHKQLAEAVRTWPKCIYDPYIVAQEARKKLASMPEGPELKQALADLYALSGRDERAVALQLELGDRSVVEYIREHGLVPAAAERVADVVLLHPDRALDVLVQKRDDMPPQEVVRQLMDRGERRHAFTYLKRLWEADPSAGSDLHGLQAELCAEFEPELMLPFLQSSVHLPLEHALEACKRHGLLQEQVYVLGRMGNSREAVRLLLHELGDVPQALELAEAKGEEDLWEELLSHCFARPELLPDLLDKAGSRLSALRLIQRLPKDRIDVPRLRDRLRAALSAQRSQVMLWRSCADILGADVVELELQRESTARRALSTSSVSFA